MNDINIIQIKSACTKRVLNLLEEMSHTDLEKYRRFWKAFGPVLKEGITEDYANYDRLRFFD